MTARRNRWALWGTGTAILLSSVGVAVHFDLPSDARAATEEAAAPPAVPVTVATLRPENITTWQEFSGRLEAVDRVEIRSRVAGEIRSVHFREGGLVKTGDPLISVDPAPFEAAVAQADAQVTAARARLDLADIELERGKVLSTGNTISRSEFSQRESARAQADAALRSAEATLRIAKLDLGYTEIRAPIAGRAGKLEITPGNLIAAGAASPVLMTLVSVDPVYASFNVSEDMAARMLEALPAKEGMPAIEQVPVEITVLGDGKVPVRGSLQFVDNEVDRTSGTVRLRAVFANPEGRLIPGQFVRIRLGEPKAEDRLAVSERAIGTDQDKKFVLVVGTDNVASYRQIELGAKVEGKRIVEKGLNAGERIVVNGLQRIRPGAAVTPTEDGEVARQ
ncbi:efflux RND transporter periplasmic adaptor subunit [Rhizobiaceae bacterium BDR2-2]|uniref:Efflux RND transporter periplasmic adaptor subunit n=1 Tax=Ectorhizobium quercum TaxID=2965071 RepID=A0AAE3MXX2_9HYPH|nr:efflux RND transporter periplasmic adaptor subunit [Ectorhizobium quercum]MCX8997048.1 efflux RND transporter periplasmic adaptor subunit [Ectorhizobium quercum]